jgi:branched-chain amino acid transport system permease protein
MRFILMGVGLMLLMVFRPQGIFGNKQELALDDR